jgi:hypothetical protein
MVPCIFNKDKNYRLQQHFFSGQLSVTIASFPSLPSPAAILAASRRVVQEDEGLGGADAMVLLHRLPREESVRGMPIIAR